MSAILFSCLFCAVVWGLIALFVRRYPETMAGYNTMPRHKREKIDLPRIARWVSNSMYGGIPFMLLSPLMPTKRLFLTMLLVIPIGLLLAVAIYVNCCPKRFEKR